MTLGTKLICVLVLLGAGGSIVLAQGPCGGKPCTGRKVPTQVQKRQSTAKPRSGTKAPLPIKPDRNALLVTVPWPLLFPAVANAKLTAIDGTTFKLADYTGKVVLVNLWATWCGPCRLEIPELVKLHKRFKSRGVEIVGLSTENPDYAVDSVRRFLDDYQVRYRMGWALPDFTLTLMQGREVIPQTFVISRDGRVVKRFVGFNATQNPRLIGQAIEAALRNKAESVIESTTLRANPTAGTIAGTTPE